MYFKQRIGKLGEDIACTYLENNKYNIIERNFICKQGEIDIIAKDKEKGELVFVEVKTRSNFKYGQPCEAINNEKRKHIYNSSKYYLYKNGLLNIAIRLDVIEVIIENGKCKVNHIEKAFFK